MNYNAFISYRHSELDMFVAKQVHKRLETFKVPRKVQKETGFKSIERVFRDQEELPIGSNLSDNICEALQNSEYLIVICSPRTPESYWVQKEIQTFIEMHDREHVLAVLIEGEPDESFPEALRFDEQGNPVEPLAADVRGATQAEMKKKMPTEFMRLAAPLLHCTYDDLRQRHKERQMHRAMAIMSGVMGLGIVFGVYYAYTAAQIRENYREKQINQSKYLADTALQLIDEGDRITAIQVAEEALPVMGDRPYVANAEYALSQGLNVYTDNTRIYADRVLNTDLPVKDFNFSPDGNTIVLWDSANKAYVYNVADGSLILAVDGPLDENYSDIALNGAFITSDQHLLLGYGDRVVCYDFDGKELWTQMCDVDPFLACETFFYDDNLGLAVATGYNNLVAWNQKGEELLNLKPGKDEASFSPMLNGTFSPDGTLLAVSRLADAEQGELDVYDLASGEVRAYTTFAPHIDAVAFLDATHLAVASSRAGDAVRAGKVELIDLDSGSSSWSTDYTDDSNALTPKGFAFLPMNVTGGDGTQRNLVNCFVNNHFFALDAATGEVCFELSTTSPIVGFLGNGNDQVALWEQNGQLSFVSLDSGKSRNSAVPGNITNVTATKFTSSLIAVQPNLKPQVVLMSIPQDPNLEDFCTTDDTVKKTMFTEDGAYVVVVSESDEGIRRVEAYNYVTKASVGSVDVANGIETVVGKDHDLFVVDSVENVLYKYEITETGLTEVAHVSVDGENDYPFDQEHYRYMDYGTGGYQVIDLEKMDVICQNTTLPVFLGAIGGTEGDTIAYVSSDNILHIKNEHTKDEVEVQEDSMRTKLTTTNAGGLALSPDGRYVAMNCLDSNIRVYDIEKERIKAEIPFGGRSFAYVAFTPDSEKLLMQGDDYTLKVYDVAANNMLLEGSSEMFQIERADYLKDDSGKIAKVALHTSGALYLLDTDSFETTAKITNGCDISLEQDAILSANNKQVVKMPYYSLDELYELAEEQTGGVRLSNQKRVQLHVD